MRRGVVFFFGLASIATGLWFIASEHSRTASCNASGGSLPGASPACQTIGWMYFAGFVIAGLGVMVLIFASLMKRHELRYHRQQHAAHSEIAIRMGAEASRVTRRSASGSSAASGGRLGDIAPAPPR
jgi:hypothetical protein